MITSEIIGSGHMDDLALLKISDLILLLPQRDVGALESVIDVDTHEPRPGSVGWFQYAQQQCPVYCLSSDLSLIDEIPDGRRVCASLRSGSGYIGILCDEVGINNQVHTGQRHALPIAMHIPDTPVLGLLSFDEGQIACITGGESLAAHIFRQVQN